MSVIIPKESGGSAVGKGSTSPSLYSQINAWRLLGWLGTIYLVLSLLDLALGWYPVSFGTPEWEFGTVSATIAGLAIPTLALYLILSSAIAREQRNVAKGVAVMMIVLAVSLAILFILYLTAVPLALRAVVSNPIIHLGIKKSIAKSLILFLGYEVLYIHGAAKVLRGRTAG